MIKAELIAYVATKISLYTTGTRNATPTSCTPRADLYCMAF